MKSFYFALQHLTRIRVYNGPFEEVSFGRMSAFFPVVGLILGLLLYACFTLYHYLFPAPVVAALLMITLVVLTGGMHLDGFMDTMDGIFSGRAREQKLEIMRDSRVGAFGVLGLVCLFTTKFAVLTTLTAAMMLQAILLAMVISRWAMAYVIKFFPYVRKEGLGSLISKYAGSREMLIATACTFIIVGVVAGAAGFLILGVIWGWAHYFGRYVTKQLGGLTGDIYGATAEINEILVFLLIYPLFNYGPLLFNSPLGLLK